jgi:hypothetical protein
VLQVDEPSFFLVFTDSREPGPVVRCDPIAQSELDRRIVICSADPPVSVPERPIRLDGSVSLPQPTHKIIAVYDRFRAGSWLPLQGRAEVGVLLGNINPAKEPELASLELAYWASAFADGEAAERAVAA